MTSSAAIVKENIQALRKSTKKALRSKREAKESLIRAGILTKSGNRLSKPYR